MSAGWLEMDNGFLKERTLRYHLELVLYDSLSVPVIRMERGVREKKTNEAKKRKKVQVFLMHFWPAFIPPYRKRVNFERKWSYLFLNDCNTLHTLYIIYSMIYRNMSLLCIEFSNFIGVGAGGGASFFFKNWQSHLDSIQWSYQRSYYIVSLNIVLVVTYRVVQDPAMLLEPTSSASSENFDGCLPKSPLRQAQPLGFVCCPTW